VLVAPVSGEVRVTFMERLLLFCEREEMPAGPEERAGKPG